MTTILISILLLTDIIKFVIIIDIILSWLSLVGLNIRPKFVSDIIDPIYKNVRNIITTSFGPIDFTPIIILFILIFIKALVFSYDINIQSYYLDITNF